jgi:uncharacterized repeat protein (TIGR01451 family)
MKKIYGLISLLFLSFISFGQFGQPQEIAQTTYRPFDVYTADIDGDGDLDLLSASTGDNKIAWYENLDGNGNFSPQKIITNSAEHAYSVFSIDIDGDGDMDVLSASVYDDKIAWYENIDGNGSFGPTRIISTLADDPRSIYSCDIDNDGDMDVLSASSEDNKIAWYENIDGSGGFSAQQIISTNTEWAETVYASDIDGDGDMDVLSASYIDDKIAWYENTDGNGNFSQEQIITTAAWGANTVYTSDIDGDGDMDVLAASEQNDKITWYENIDGNGNFSQEQIITSIAHGAFSVFSIDIDGDGDMDVLSASSDDHKIAWYENTDGNGNFGPEIIISTSAQCAKAVYSCDIDGDGDMDVMSASFSDNKIAWYENTNVNGNFGEQQIVPAKTDSPESVFSSDIDGDGDMDVLSASSYDDMIAWYENTDGNGEFGEQKVITTSAISARCVYSSDIDGDGDMDVLSASYLDDKIAWYENTDGNGNFGPQIIISTNAVYARSVYSCDIDGDGDMDVLSASSGDNKIAWYENTDGNGTFSTEQIITTLALGTVSVYACDIDGDEDLDVLTTSPDNNKVTWYENINGDGNFSTEIIITNNLIGANSVYSCDIDGDGDMDVLSASYTDDKIAWYENTDGDGNFSINHTVSTSALDARAVYSCDADNDGDMDVFVASSLESIIWYENIDGNGTFGEKHIITNSAAISRSVYSSDIDGDGDLDVLSASAQDDKIAWYENLFDSSYILEGSVFFDYNQNGIKDSLDNDFAYAQASLQPNALTSYTNEQGEYWFAVDTGNYTVSYSNLQNLSNWFLTTNVIEYNVQVSSNEPIIDGLDFGFYPSNFSTEVNPEITASPYVCGSEATYWINYNNSGTTKPNGIVELLLDESITFISSEILPDSVIGQRIYWHFDTLNFFASGQIPLIVQVPDFNSMGDTLVSTLSIYTTDSTGQSLFSDSLSEVLTCSYDPNDKLVTPRGVGQQGIISKDETLEYTVRFQNTGNAEAINVKIRDQVDSNLDIQSIEVLATSHHVQTFIQENRWLVFQFDSIMLPDSTSNELESHGYIKYSAQINEDVLPNTQIYNTAHIYFDYNPAVITNTVKNTVECFEAPEQAIITQNGDLLQINSEDDIQWFFNGSMIIGANEPTYSYTEPGDYTVILTDVNNCFTESEVYSVSNVEINYNKQNVFMVYPNPTKDLIVIETYKTEAEYGKVYSIDGVLIESIELKGDKTIISTKNWGEGVYILHVGQETKSIICVP